MRITVTGSLGNVSRSLVQKLVDAKHQVSVISSDPGRIEAIQRAGATPLIGSVEDAAFTGKAFEGADAVYTMIPPDFSVPDHSGFTANVIESYANAIRGNGIRYVVNLSSIGSALSGTGPLKNYYNLESGLDGVDALNILHLRPGMFYTNFYGFLPMIRQQGIIGHNVDAGTDLLMTDPRDIAAAAFEALHHLSFTGIGHQYIISDVKNGSEIAAVLGKAIGIPALPWIQFPDGQLLMNLVSNGFPEDAAQTYVVDMGIAIREGLLNEFYRKHQLKINGQSRFEGFAAELAGAYGRS
jgi:uncharacterized protein YbjT (DUF2867 family)